ncbi:MAG: ornithine decarboxylase [Myxococcota bacterium]|jgi:ornithine decarboxylase
MTVPLHSIHRRSVFAGFDLPEFEGVDEVVRSFADDNPVHCIFPDRVAQAAKRFLSGFKGTVAYAVKCNPHPLVLSTMWEAGIRHFDVASRVEVDVVSATAPVARQWFMHPVKSRAALLHAGNRGVTDFSFDTHDELEKICAVLGDVPLGLHLRLALPCYGAVWDLTGKFGASPDESVDLLRAARSRCEHLGIAFHVGSQCMSPEVYERAIAVAAEVCQRAEVSIDSLDVGGGFPADYPGLEAPPLAHFFDAIHAAAVRHGFADTPLICEPGRAMVATAGSLLVRVDLRRGDRLYINDGTYGALFDAGSPKWRFPARLVRPTASASSTLVPFKFLGPTCDSLDAMDGPFFLPDDTREGDWIEISQLGAYGAALRTAFNGFSELDTVVIR